MHKKENIHCKIVIINHNMWNSIRSDVENERSILTNKTLLDIVREFQNRKIFTVSTDARAAIAV
jgi:hypothetical protein